MYTKQQRVTLIVSEFYLHRVRPARQPGRKPVTVLRNNDQQAVVITHWAKLLCWLLAMKYGKAEVVLQQLLCRRNRIGYNAYFADI